MVVVVDDEPLSEAHIVVLIVVVDVEVRDEVRTDVVVDAEVFVVDVFEVVTDAEGVAVVITEGILLEVVSVAIEPVSVVTAEELCAGAEVPVVLFVSEPVCVFVVEDDVTAPAEISGKAVCMVVCIVEEADAETVIFVVVCVTGSDEATVDVWIISKLFKVVVVTVAEV